MISLRDMFNNLSTTQQLKTKQTLHKYISLRSVYKARSTSVLNSRNKKAVMSLNVSNKDLSEKIKTPNQKRS